MTEKSPTTPSATSPGATAPTPPAAGATEDVGAADEGVPTTFVVGSDVGTSCTCTCSEVMLWPFGASVMSTSTNVGAEMLAGGAPSTGCCAGTTLTC